MDLTKLHAQLLLEHSHAIATELITPPISTIHQSQIHARITPQTEWKTYYMKMRVEKFRKPQLQFFGSKTKKKPEFTMSDAQDVYIIHRDCPSTLFEIHGTLRPGHKYTGPPEPQTLQLMAETTLLLHSWIMTIYTEFHIPSAHPNHFKDLLKPYLSDAEFNDVVKPDMSFSDAKHAYQQALLKKEGLTTEIPLPLQTLKQNILQDEINMGPASHSRPVKQLPPPTPTKSAVSAESSTSITPVKPSLIDLIATEKQRIDSGVKLIDAAAQKKSERRRTLMEGQQHVREGFQSKQQNKSIPKSSNHNLQADDDDDDDDVPIASQLANVKLQSEHENSDDEPLQGSNESTLKSVAISDKSSITSTPIKLPKSEPKSRNLSLEHPSSEPKPRPKSVNALPIRQLLHVPSKTKSIVITDESEEDDVPLALASSTVSKDIDSSCGSVTSDEDDMLAKRIKQATKSGVRAPPKAAPNKKKQIPPGQRHSGVKIPRPRSTLSMLSTDEDETPLAPPRKPLLQPGEVDNGDIPRTENTEEDLPLNQLRSQQEIRGLRVGQDRSSPYFPPMQQPKHFDGYNSQMYQHTMPPAAGHPPNWSNSPTPHFVSMNATNTKPEPSHTGLMGVAHARNNRSIAYNPAAAPQGPGYELQNGANMLPSFNPNLIQDQSHIRESVMSTNDLAYQKQQYEILYQQNLQLQMQMQMQMQLQYSMYNQGSMSNVVSGGVPSGYSNSIPQLRPHSHQFTGANINLGNARVSKVRKQFAGYNREVTPAPLPFGMALPHQFVRPPVGPGSVHPEMYTHDQAETGSQYQTR